MPLPSLFKRHKTPAEPVDQGALNAGGPVQQARAQARRRLIGAVVLLAIGLVLFPLLFESKPRPVPVDLPIELSRKENAAPARVPAPAAPRAVPLKPLPADAGAETATPQPAASAVPAAATPPPEAPPAAREPVPSPAEPPRPVAAAEPASAGASVPRIGRFVVQVGAFTDAVALRDVRQKVEKLGLKTYTQVVETDAGKRTRVRVGPFETRDEADRAGARLKGAGLPAYILAL